MSREDKRKDLRYCSLHESSESEKINAKIDTKKGPQTFSFHLNNLPSSKGVAFLQQPTKTSKGIAYDRMVQRVLKDMQNDIVPNQNDCISSPDTVYENDDTEKAKMRLEIKALKKKEKEYKSEVASWRLLAQQGSELHTPTKDTHMNDSVEELAGISSDEDLKNSKTPSYTRIKKIHLLNIPETGS